MAKSPTSKGHHKMIQFLLCKVRDDTMLVWASNANHPLCTLNREQESEYQFLCVYQGRCFVSNIKYDATFGKYVDTGKQAIQLSAIDSIYLLEMESNNE